MFKIPVKLPVIIEIDWDCGESETEHYADNVVDFLSNYASKRVKHQYLGYLGRRSVVAFYTNASDPELKKEIKKVQEQQAIEQEPDYCSKCNQEI